METLRVNPGVQTGRRARRGVVGGAAARVGADALALVQVYTKRQRETKNMAHAPLLLPKLKKWASRMHKLKLDTRVNPNRREDGPANIETLRSYKSLHKRFFYFEESVHQQSALYRVIKVLCAPK